MGQDHVNGMALSCSWRFLEMGLGADFLGGGLDCEWEEDGYDWDCGVSHRWWVFGLSSLVEAELMGCERFRN